MFNTALFTIADYPATMQQLCQFFGVMAGHRPQGIYPPDMPEHTLEAMLVCRCTHRAEAHEPAHLNKWRPCGYSWCPCWRFRPMIEPVVAPMLPGMIVINHAAPSVPS